MQPDAQFIVQQAKQIARSCTEAISINIETRRLMTDAFLNHIRATLDEIEAQASQNASGC